MVFAQERTPPGTKPPVFSQKGTLYQARAEGLE